MGGWIYISHSSHIHIESSNLTQVAQTVSKNVFYKNENIYKDEQNVLNLFDLYCFLSDMTRQYKRTQGWRMLDVWYIWPPRDPKKIMFYPTVVTHFRTPFCLPEKVPQFISCKLNCWKKRKLWKQCLLKSCLLCFGL